MSSGSESEHSDAGAAHVEAPVEKYLRLAATTDDFLRTGTDSGERPGAFVMLNVGGITAAERDEPDPSE
jgi:hypothetical protein